MSKIVLIVDDEAILLEFASETLVLEGFKVEQAASAEEAIEILKEKSVDLVVSDYTMSGLSGLDLAQKMRSDLKLKIPFILLSGRVDFPASRLKDYDINKVFEKPVMFDEVVSYIKEKILTI